MTKREQTCLERYGVKNISQTKEVREAISRANTKYPDAQPEVWIENDFDLLETLRTYPMKGVYVGYSCQVCGERVRKLIEGFRASPVRMCRRHLREHNLSNTI